ncbi:MAG: transcriptional regulator [Candidatus Baltobacteraceae bacterium]
MTRGLIADNAHFRRDFDLAPFGFEHALANHPLLSAEHLLGLAKEMSADSRDIYYDAGEVRVDQRRDQTPFCDLPVAELLGRIETAGAWVVLRRAEKLPIFAELLDACMARIEALSGRDLRAVTKVSNAIVFINSPHRISTYHIDRECNFLLQIRGAKTISVFDRDDRDVLPEAEVERFWTVDNNSAVYKPQLQDRAHVFELAPGFGVHIPVNAPHWVQNGPEVAVSLSINFHYHDALLADVYRANYWLRRLGLRPASPRSSALRDGVKSTLYRSVRALRHTGRVLRIKN